MDKIFNPRTVVIVICLFIILLAITFVSSSLDLTPTSAENHNPSSYSNSALGHTTLYKILKNLNRPVIRSARDSLAVAKHNNGLLILAEPLIDMTGEVEDFQDKLAPRTLVVLPKRQGTVHETNRGWISTYTQLPLKSVNDLLEAVTGDKDSSVVRRDGWPRGWSVNEIGVTPTGQETLQYIRSNNINPIVGTRDNILLGEITMDGNIVWILSDPDIMENHGIQMGDNALFMVTLIDKLRLHNDANLTFIIDTPIPANAPIVFDEVIHGYSEPDRNFIDFALEFPYIVAVGLIFMAGLMFVLSGVSRFGKPSRVPKPIDFGKAGLINKSARLIDYRGYHTHVLRRYVVMVINSVAHELHAPTLNQQELVVWLDKMGKSKKMHVYCADILHNIQSTEDDKKIFEYVHSIYQWRRGMLNE